MWSRRGGPSASAANEEPASPRRLKPFPQRPHQAGQTLRWKTPRRGLCLPRQSRQHSLPSPYAAPMTHNRDLALEIARRAAERERGKSERGKPERGKPERREPAAGWDDDLEFRSDARWRRRHARAACRLVAVAGRHRRADRAGAAAAPADRRPAVAGNPGPGPACAGRCRTRAGPADRHRRQQRARTVRGRAGDRPRPQRGPRRPDPGRGRRVGAGARRIGARSLTPMPAAISPWRARCRCRRYRRTPSPRNCAGASPVTPASMAWWRRRKPRAAPAAWTAAPTPRCRCTGACSNCSPGVPTRCADARTRSPTCSMPRALRCAAATCAARRRASRPRANTTPATSTCRTPWRG